LKACPLSPVVAQVADEVGEAAAARGAGGGGGRAGTRGVVQLAHEAAVVQLGENGAIGVGGRHAAGAQLGVAVLEVADDLVGGLRVGGGEAPSRFGAPIRHCRLR
jgi:hypothetical protein